MEWKRDGYVLTDDAAAADMDWVERMMRTTYWAPRRPREVIETSIRNAVVFSAFDEEGQVGFARVVSDFSTFAWIADVIVDPGHRGRGLGKWIMETIMAHPAVTTTTQQLLRTKDAHELYRRYGFDPSECMRRKPEGAF
jgi:GNAT superfamily N-acetyltransferase